MGDVDDRVSGYKDDTFFVRHQERLFMRRKNYTGPRCNKCDKASEWFEHDPPEFYGLPGTSGQHTTPVGGSLVQYEWCNEHVPPEVLAIWAMASLG